MKKGHLARGARLEEFVQLLLFLMRNVNEFPKGIGLVSNLISFLGEKKKRNLFFNIFLYFLQK